MQNIQIYFLLLAFASMTLSCNLRIGDSPSSVFEFSDGCLSKIENPTDKYLAGQLEEEKIEEIYTCITQALTQFKNEVRGNIRGEFTPDELRKFIQDVVIKDIKISDTLMAQLAKLKRVIIGGSEKKLTTKDIDLLIKFLGVLKEEIVFFQPYIQALNKPGLHVRLEGDRRLSIEKKLKDSVDRFSDFINKFSEPYLLKDVQILIEELVHFSNPDKKLPLLDQKIQLIGVLKQFVAGGSDQIILPNEWKDLFVGYSYLISMSVNGLFLKSQEMTISPEGMKYIFSIIDDLQNFLKVALNNRPNKIIVESEFLKLANHLQSTHILSQRLEKRSIKKLLLIFFGKVFNTDKKQYGTIQLTMAQLDSISQNVQSWKQAQRFLNEQAAGDFFEKNIMDVKKQQAFFSSKEANKVMTLEVIQTAQQTIENITQLKPLYKDKESKIFVSGSLYPKEGEQQQPPNYRSLTIYNFYHFIAHMMRLGYGRQDAENIVIGQKELSHFFDDFHLISENMGWTEPTDIDSLEKGEGEFVSANMLTPSTTGFNLDWRTEELLTSNEIVEYLAYALSFSASLEELEEAFSKKCTKKLAESEDDVLYEIQCFRENLLPILQEKMLNMPDLQKVLATMNEEEREGLREAFIRISYESQQEFYSEAIHVSRRHLRGLIMAIYFVETTINRWDSNGDLELQDDEIWTAYPRFGGYISRNIIFVACYSSDKLARSAYAYVVGKTEMMPNDHDSSWSKIKAFLLLESHNFLLENNADYQIWNLHLNREKLTLIFSSILRVFLQKKAEMKDNNIKCLIPEEDKNAKENENEDENEDEEEFSKNSYSRKRWPNSRKRWSTRGQE